MQVDKLAETKGMDYLDREKAKRHAKQQAENLYDQVLNLHASRAVATGQPHTPVLATLLLPCSNFKEHFCHGDSGCMLFVCTLYALCGHCVGIAKYI